MVSIGTRMNDSHKSVHRPNPQLCDVRIIVHNLHSLLLFLHRRTEEGRERTCSSSHLHAHMPVIHTKSGQNDARHTPVVRCSRTRRKHMQSSKHTRLSDVAQHGPDRIGSTWTGGDCGGAVGVHAHRLLNLEGRAAEAVERGEQSGGLFCGAGGAVVGAEKLDHAHKIVDNGGGEGG